MAVSVLALIPPESGRGPCEIKGKCEPAVTCQAGPARIDCLKNNSTPGVPNPLADDYVVLAGQHYKIIPQDQTKCKAGAPDCSNSGVEPCFDFKLYGASGCGTSMFTATCSRGGFCNAIQ